MKDRLVGIVLGTAVGDALGLPSEGLSPRRRRRLMPGPWRHRLIFGRGMISDDTEHTLFVAQSLLDDSDNVEKFQRRLARRLRWWFASLPPGIGRATAKACIKLWLGFSPKRSGVFSAGNGPAMRSALIGGYFFDRPEAIERFVHASTQITHTDPKAVVGALAIAKLAAHAVGTSPGQSPDVSALAVMLMDLAPADHEWTAWIDKMLTALAARTSVTEFATGLNLERGVTGYMYHTVPVAAYAWLRHYGDFHSTLEAALACGGDADTVGAIAGALAGATVGENGIPSEWLRGILDWPRSICVLRKIACQLGERQCGGSVGRTASYFWPAVLPRNLILLAIILFHGFRRLAPPY